MASGGRSPDAETIGIDAVFGGVRAYEAHRAAAILDFNRIMVGFDAVIKNEGGHTLLIEPGRDLKSFVTDGNMLVASAGNDKDGGAGRAVPGQEDIHTRFVGLRVAECTGRIAGPQIDGFG